MTKRYARVQTPDGRVHYGFLHLSRELQVLDAPPWLGGQATEQVLPPETYQLLAPCAPGKVVAVGKNYAKHAAEMGGSVPQEPLIFLKPPTTVIADGETILYPPQSQRVDYEGELALVIGDRVCCCTPEDARRKIWGYTIANDVTARDLQQLDKTWVRGKGFDSFCPLGPWIVREISPGATLQTFLNGSAEPIQCSTIDQMVFSPETLVSYISHIMTLLPGDVVLTGTPSGVGPMQVGDTVQVEVEGIGRLINPVGQRSIAAEN
ncbi:fumarylacetoacetate hydrolase family protein [Prochlorothrix hollandica]|uniref:5-oxo-1,2,5-tricarboxylic-3-penten acid decarboxylase n=1 Tax=Prochlorothrix hollandica PCC 9006 = CALU 1027 TaxID=317619 RepID=A0A0M2Q1G5_PROHO|nr:fumarylacetoacetate hydrolase family protein [Prochlorothrix hollandica]KKJ01143.1 5-oxo-1,2,5-tricarboxylic-3-penten acid decarboxylase [Prochlorothrix hollandica PCC 9006 = CALU 1027]